jgi:hypothetical protein
MNSAQMDRTDLTSQNPVVIITVCLNAAKREFW